MNQNLHPEVSTLTPPHEFAAHAVAADVEARMGQLETEAEAKHGPAQVLLGSYFIWKERPAGDVLRGQWLVEAMLDYRPPMKQYTDDDPRILIDALVDPHTPFRYTDIRGEEQ